MTNLARHTLNLQNHGNTTLNAKYLESVCVERDVREGFYTSTAWIFSDGSALIESQPHKWQVKTNYGLHSHHEKLC
jgi:hypothetical protein